MNAEPKDNWLLVQRSSFRVHCFKTGGDDRIRTCEGLLTLNGLANRRLQPLGHISAPDTGENHSSRGAKIVKVTTNCVVGIVCLRELWSMQRLLRFFGLAFLT
jgi:hypothetical protein